MIVFNTTFHVEEEVHEDFIEYMLQIFIPHSTRSGLLTSPRLARVMGKEEDEGYSYAMEFTASGIAELDRWNAEESTFIYTPLLHKFKEKIAGFSTVMLTVDY
ncbi:MAG TPA: hypothetical protein DDZ96_02150 [Porphyromonadaceae bacterium]|jgi:hypothetical protein|uniref:DUF4286 family protein n=1 Tax=Limibacterium fermenti TaxID=3229863 RepID=UPI000E93A221|nr:hypothetical protein [Porphyromonadaceae bacterium]HBL32606.1 hypothetical protein [Porphyromonadaceae bacterium]HBX19639.1 hypothetical protein [Porphyromonadaceae bacterium]HBX45422.1 hypothetical protein [Porphyromonadaceae bacterium]HCM20943.1 hypothetical protein [Porphyromonadaceae bacterium]